MKYAVAYYTRSGNTKKIAETIAEVLGVTPFDIADGMSEKADVLFLGSSLYAFSYDPAVEKFIQDNAESIGQIVSFSTSASGKSTAKFVKETAEKCGIKFYPHAYKCYGKFGILNPSRPGEKDFVQARVFAKSVVADLGDPS